jgi:hypothetical protein
MVARAGGSEGRGPTGPTGICAPMTSRGTASASTIPAGDGRRRQSAELTRLRKRYSSAPPCARKRLTRPSIHQCPTCLPGITVARNYGDSAFNYLATIIRRALPATTRVNEVHCHPNRADSWRVGWVERSDTHQSEFAKMGFAKSSTHPTRLRQRLDSGSTSSALSPWIIAHGDQARLSKAFC